jgi:hypothetical protein
MYGSIFGVFNGKIGQSRFFVESSAKVGIFVESLAKVSFFSGKFGQSRVFVESLAKVGF